MRLFRPRASEEIHLDCIREGEDSRLFLTQAPIVGFLSILGVCNIHLCSLPRMRQKGSGLV
jgi:hypothetical protein